MHVEETVGVGVGLSGSIGNIYVPSQRDLLETCHRNVSNCWMHYSDDLHSILSIYQALNSTLLVR